MTTQSVSCTTGNPSMSKVFSDSATNNIWSGNVMLDTIASQSIGILIPNSTLTFMQPSYEAGCMAYRLQNAQTLAVSNFGFGVKGSQENFSLSRINPVRVNPNDILTAYPMPVHATPAVSNALAWVTTSKGVELFSSPTAGLPNGVATAMITAVNNQTLGDAFFGSRLSSIVIQLEDGALCDSIQIIDEMGGVVMTIQGGYRGLSPSSESNTYNLSVSGLNVTIGKGWSFKVVATKGA